MMPGLHRCDAGFKSTAERPMFTGMGQVAVTDRAARRIAEITAAEGRTALRVAVLAGGCNGFQYRFELDDATQADDVVIEQAGARLDYAEELMGSYFAVRNPQAKSSCGCGTSFSVD